MQQLMQMFGQMVCMPMNMFADVFSRTMNTVSRDASGWARGGGCGWDSSGCNSGSGDSSNHDSCRDEPCRKDEWFEPKNSCGDGWGSSGGCNDGWNTGTCGGCGKNPCGCNNRNRGCDKDCLVEYSLVSVPADGPGHVLFHGQRMVSCESRDEFNNQVICDYVQSCGHPVNCKNLRVWSRQLDSWSRPCWDYEEEQIQALRGIKRALEKPDSKAA